jgi:alkaline phosphatase
MPRYVDGFVIPLKKSKLAAYRRMAAVCGRIWKSHGALEFMECAGDDLKSPMCSRPFPKLAKARAGETVLFSFIVYKSRRDRDRVNAAVIKDPRMVPMMDPKKMPFDMKRMSYGGFRVIVDA